VICRHRVGDTSENLNKQKGDGREMPKLGRGCTADTSTSGEVRQQDRWKVTVEDNYGIKLALNCTH